MGLADLHIHTIYSYDCTAAVHAVLARARHMGLDVISITDHDEVAGSLEALELAPSYGIEVLPAVEVTTAEGDLLAFNIPKKIQRDMPLIETVLEVRELGGFCIAPHVAADSVGMKSLSAYSIMKALNNPAVAQTLIAIETYNATVIDRASNHYASILADLLHIAQTGSSDAHIVEAIGLGSTEFEGHTAQDLMAALQKGTTRPRMLEEWNSMRILSSWAANYIRSAFARVADILYRTSETQWKR